MDTALSQEHARMLRESDQDEDASECVRLNDLDAFAGRGAFQAPLHPEGCRRVGSRQDHGTAVARH